jgi:hypothetical protein
MTKNVRRHLRRMLLLSPEDRMALFAAFVRLGVVDIALRLAGSRALAGRRQPSPEPRGRALSDADWRVARRCAYWIDVAARHHVAHPRCLQRSLALHHWLQQQGLPSALRIGVRKEGAELKAHAWVELGGVAVNDHPDMLAGFVPLAGSGRKAAFLAADRARAMTKPALGSAGE